MPVTYPRAFAPHKIGNIKWTLDRRDVTTMDGTGRLSGAQIGRPMWRFEFDYVALDDQESVSWEAWIRSLKGAAHGFIMWDARRRYPRAYPGGWAGMTRHGGGAFDGTAPAPTLDGTRTILTISTLPTAFQVQPGDMIGLSDGTNLKRHAVEVMEPATASAGVLSVQVNPALWHEVGAWTGLYARLHEAACNFKITDHEIGDVTPHGQASGRVVAQQYLP